MKDYNGVEIELGDTVVFNGVKIIGGVSYNQERFMMVVGFEDGIVIGAEVVASRIKRSGRDYCFPYLIYSVTSPDCLRVVTIGPEIPKVASAG